MKAQYSNLQWGRVLLTSVLVIILVVILNTVLPLLATHVWGQPDQAQIAVQVSSWITYIVLLLLTFGGAVWVARRVEREAPLHGLLVGVIVAFILFLLSLGFGSSVLFSLLTFVLNVVAGLLGGVLGGRRRGKV